MLPSQQELSNLLGMLYDAAADPLLWKPFIQELSGRTRATGAVLVIHHLDQAYCRVATSWGIDPDFDALYQGHYHALDPWAQRKESLQPAVCDSESVYPIQKLRKTEFYNDFLSKAKIEHAMFGVMENSKSLLACVSLYRDRSRSEFAKSDLQLLNLLAPHLQRAFNLHFRFADIKTRSSSFENAFDMVRTGIALLGANGDIVFVNRTASALLAEKDGLLISGRRFQAERQPESEPLTNAIGKAGFISNDQITSTGSAVLISRRTRPPLQLFIAPIRPSALQLSHEIAIVVFINDPSRNQRPADTLLRTVYGLTRAECRVALLLSDGRAPKEIANKIGVTENTVRSQIKSIYNKIGVKRQSELVRLLLNHSFFDNQPLI